MNGIATILRAIGTNWVTALWIDRANAGDDLAAAILHGDADVAGLYYKHNNREYLAEGVRLAMSWLTDQHTIELSSGGMTIVWIDGGRLIYDQVNGELIFRETYRQAAPTIDWKVQQHRRWR